MLNKTILPLIYSLLSQVNYYCDNKIYSDINLLTQDEIINLCHKINKYNQRYSILISNSPYYTQFLNDNYFTEQCQNFFDNYNKDLENGISFCVFITSYTFNNAQGKIRIIYGHKVLHKINNNIRNSIVNIMSSYLKNKMFYKAFDKGIDEFNDYLYEGHSFLFKFFFYFLIPLFFIGGLYYYCFIYKKKEDNNLLLNNNNFTPQYESLIDDNNNNNHIQMENYPTYNEVISSNPIYNHILFLENLINQLKYLNPQIITIDKCLICLKQIIINYNNNYNKGKQIEMYNFDTQIENYNNNNIDINFYDKNNTRFSCGHIFHNECLRKCNLGKCIICFNNNSNGKCNEIIDNKINTQVIDENNVKNLIINFNKIYSNNDLKNFSIDFKNDFIRINHTFNNQLQNYWGIN